MMQVEICYDSWTLQQLADEANEAGGNAERQQKASVQNARQAGLMLIAAKAKVAHGEWSKWMEENWSLSARRASSFMRLAKMEESDLDIFESVHEAEQATSNRKAPSDLEIKPLTDEQIEKDTPLTQPSTHKVTAATQKKTDSGTSGGEVSVGKEPTTASQVPPDQTAFGSDPAQSTIQPVEDAETRVLFALREIGQVISEVKDRKKLAAKIRKLADEIDPPAETARFKPPTVADVQVYCEERRNNIDSAQFVDFYASKNWMVGKNKMKDWKASVRTAEKKGWCDLTTESSRVHGMDWSEFDEE